MRFSTRFVTRIGSVFLHLTVIDLEVPVADGHTPKVDSSAKFVGLVGAVLLLAAIYYLVTSLIHVITGQTYKNEFAPSATTTEAAATPAAAPAETAAPAAAAPAAAAASGSGDAAAGKTKYATCAACHGADGKGNGGAFPDLTKLNAADAEAILHAFKKGDKDFLAKHGLGGARYGTMAPQAAGLSDADIADLGAYIAELGGHSASAAAAPAGAAPAAAPAAAPTQKIVSSEVVAWGHALFSSCAVCHGAAGEGGKLFGAPKLAGLPYNSVVSLLGLYRKGQQMGTNSYAMIPQAKHLTDSEINALASYIAVMNTSADPGATATE